MGLYYVYMKTWQVVLIIILILLGVGMFYFLQKGAVVINETVNHAELRARDAVLRSASQQVVAAAELYRSSDGGNYYGISATQNFCTSAEAYVTQILDSLKKYSTFAECQTSSSYPATSFTVIAEANEVSGYFCTDYNGHAGIISDLTSIKRGVSCK